MYADEFSIYAGNANRPLAERICRYLQTDIGAVEVFQFANENIFVRVMENVREQDVFLVQPTSRPVNQSIMELLIMIDAFKRASAGRITAVRTPGVESSTSCSWSGRQATSGVGFTCDSSVARPCVSPRTHTPEV